jgi:hypothetical protein
MTLSIVIFSIMTLSILTFSIMKLSITTLSIMTLSIMRTYEWAKLARVLHHTRLEWLATDKHTSLLGPFMSWEENKSC